jgi:predicted nuclease of predicted toxin-antitoxin system
LRLLIDECLPRQIKGWLAGVHDAVTVREMGWANVKNGKLLRAANEAGFEVFVTADKNMYLQQNFDGLRISAVVVPSNRKLLVQKSVPALLQSLEHIQPGQNVVMDLGPDADAWESMRLHAIELEALHTTHVFRSPSAQ